MPNVKMLQLGLGSGLALLIAACSTPLRAERGAFKLEDVVHTSDDAVRVEVNHREVPLEEMPLASLLAGLPMSGLADVAIDLTVPGAGGKHDYRQATGSIALACPAGCTLGDDASKLQPSKPAGASGIPFGHVTFDKVDVRAEVRQGRVKVTRWQVASKDVAMDLRLDIQLAPNLADSTIDGCLRFKPTPSLEQRDPKTAAVISTSGAPRGPDGAFTIKIEGRVGEKKLLGQACT